MPQNNDYCVRGARVDQNLFWKRVTEPLTAATLTVSHITSRHLGAENTLDLISWNCVRVFVRGGSKLVVNELEAFRVRQIFDLYLHHQSLLVTARELGSRGWHSKAWVTKAGSTKGRQPFQKTMLHQLLTNVLYAGQVRHKDQVYVGEHPGIVDPGVFQTVQVVLQQNGRSGGTDVRNKHGALLKGLLYCTHCHSSMVHHYSQKNGRRYQYYVCLSAQKLGWDTCVAPSLPAGEIEQFIVDQIRHIGQDPDLIRETLEKARQHVTERAGQLQAELAAVHRQRHRDEAELQKVAGAVDGDSSLARLADLQERLRIANEQSTEILAELDQLQAEQIDETEVANALTEFDEVWQVLSSKEQARVLQLLIQRVDYHGETGDVTLNFYPTGLSAVSETLEESAA